jgi:hypothetical protein
MVCFVHSKRDTVVIDGDVGRAPDRQFNSSGRTAAPGEAIDD